MCLIALAHRATDAFPFVLAANRDEDHARPTREAHAWDEAPDVFGGRDALHGGSWLAVTSGGRFAAVTNLRGAAQRTRSRGALVSAFVTSRVTPEEFANEVAREAHQYSGFHLLVGEAGGAIVYVSGGDNASPPRALDAGVHGLSNAPEGERWPKVELAVATMREAIDSASDPHILADRLLEFLATPRNTGRIEEEAFIVSERYGTRSSTIVIATMREIFFAEQSYVRGSPFAPPRRVYCVKKEDEPWLFGIA
ncbi:MAG TPA: NRDE family protein [Thermoanaerobaculia bacterium]|nr:NRDE family protein [Thermoanaerobaculia bacterium]